ncbi:hypothetical protein V2J09_008332 [Rumex salicifolius]
MASRKILLLSLSLSILIFSAIFAAADSAPETKSPPEEEEEDLSFLEEPKPPSYASHGGGYGSHGGGGEDPHAAMGGGDDGGEYENFQKWNSQFAPPSVEEKDVVALNGSDFADFIAKNKYVMVEFYAPWCGHCQSLAPEYAAAATELKAEDAQVVLAKVDATAESKLADEYKVEGFPTIYFFADGEQKTYNGHRNKEAIVAWLRKKTGPGINNVTTTEQAEKVLRSDSIAVVAFLDSLTGPETNEFEAVSQLDDDVEFYQTSTPDVAKIFQIDTNAKRPVLVLLKKETEKLTTFEGNFSKSDILEFVSTNKYPLVFKFSRETGPVIFEHPINKQVMLFATANESEKYIPVFEQAAKAFKGKLVFVYVERDNEDYGTAMADYFGITGASPKLIAYTGVVEGKKFLLDGELTLETVKTFATEFLAEKLEPFYKSEPIPEDNNGIVKLVVGKNFDEIVLDESKDVLLEIYAPWCPHCHALERPYNRLALHLSEIESLVIAKMDGTTNEHPKAKSDGFPTILFFPAHNKTSEPIVYDGEHNAKELYKFIKKHASIPFKIAKPISPQQEEDAAVIESETSSDNLKDEL